MNYKNKYFKYKLKYLITKNQWRQQFLTQKLFGGSQFMNSLNVYLKKPNTTENMWKVIFKIFTNTTVEEFIDIIKENIDNTFTIGIISDPSFSVSHQIIHKPEFLSPEQKKQNILDIYNFAINGIYIILIKSDQAPVAGGKY